MRSRLLPALALGALLAVPAQASAAPRVSSLEGTAFQNDGNIRYVVFDVRASGARSVRLSWGRKHQARQRVKNGRVGIGFARKRAGSFRVAVRACRRGRCSRVRRFSGSFRIVRVNTNPPRNSDPVDTPVLPPQVIDIIGGIPQIPLPELPPLPGLPKR